MPVNANKPERWNSDISRSVDFYNSWFMQFAPKSYRDTRVETTQQVVSALAETANLTDIAPSVLRQNPAALSMLRMATAPPIARDRLIGLAGVSPNLVKNMETQQRIPPRMNKQDVVAELGRIGQIIKKLADKDIFTWLETGDAPTEAEINRAATIVADRLCGAMADPIIRNAQEQRQLAAIKRWLKQRGYTFLESGTGLKFTEMSPGTFTFRLNAPVYQQGRDRSVNVPIDAVVMPLDASGDELPLLVEAKSAGDFTNTNKRRKEEAVKVSQLRSTYGDNVRFILFLCGYFDSGYLGYEAAEGIDWVWEHRIDDLLEFGL
jgi:hypothetical protein